MSNLIINGIDHSVFDLEWVKRGGIVFCLMDYNFGISRYVSEASEDEYWIIPEGDRYAIDVHKCNIRMATPAECAEAGIEYIEPPKVWCAINNSAPLRKFISVALNDYNTNPLDVTTTEPKIIQISSVDYADGYGGFNALREDGSVIAVTFGGGLSFVDLIPTKLGRNKLHIEERTNDDTEI